MIFRLWSIALATWLMPGTLAMAGLLAYDGFNYPAGSLLAGANGGSGWTGGWVDVSGNTGESVTSGGLTAVDGAPVGFDARSIGNALLLSPNSRGGRQLNCAAGGPFALAGLLDSNGHIGADSKSVYVSFLQQPSAPGRFYEFEFHRGALGDAGRVAGIGNDTADENVYFRSGPAGGAATFWNAGAGNSNVTLYVVRIDFRPGNDDVYVYRNPTGETELDNDPVLTLISVSDMSFDGIALGAYLNGRTVKHDEIRIGTSWSSVLGDPPAFVLNPRDVKAYAGQPLTLSSLAQSSLSLFYQWHRISNGTTNLLVGQTGGALSFGSVQLADSGQYFVTASNRLGVAASAIATLRVEPIIVDLTGPVALEIETNDALHLSASVEASGPIQMQWYKDDEIVPGATEPSFSLPHASEFDAGQYFLAVHNNYGTVTSAVVNVAMNSGALLAYEGFDYGQSGGDLANGNGGFGWGGSWQNMGGGSSQILGASLVAGLSAPAGFDFASAGGSVFLASNSRKGRYLACGEEETFALNGFLNSNGQVGADAKTLYLSFLQQPDGKSQFYEFELHRGDLGDPGRLAGIGNDTADTNVHFRLQNPPGGPSTFWSLGPGTTNVNFYVVRFDFKPGNDDVFIYRNPASLLEPGTATLVLSNLADLSFDGISLAAYLNNRTVTHDEIRVGKTWRDVVGQFNPARLRIVERAYDASSLELAGAPNFNYDVQAADLPGGPWGAVGTISMPVLGVGRLLDASTNGQRFYRTRSSLAWTGAASGDTVVADFEGETYGLWVATGSAFGTGPARGTLPGQQPVSGYQGSGLVNSYLGGDSGTGTLTSPPFVITKPYINFLIGGGAIPGKECMNLVVSNVVVRTATGGDNEALSLRQWDVTAFIGQTAILQIVDLASGGWGHINIDQITLSGTPFPKLSRTMLLTESRLNLPVKNGAAMRRMSVVVDGATVRDFDIELADGVPDWWAYADVAPFSNKVATISVNNLTQGSRGLSSITQSNGIVGATNLYREALRSQVHFSSARGWLNDANGMFFYQGQYHLYYQHNPYGWSWGNMHWGHAVSPDMVRWSQMPEGIYPHSYGDMVFSGSAVVDESNTSGFQAGTNAVIVAAYTSTGRGECIAFSNDGGLTFTDYPGNPVVVHSGRDPRLLWYARSNYWVMAVYDGAGGDGIGFYTSPDLRQWTYRSKINGYFECPDIFELPVDGDPENKMWVLCDASSGYQLGLFENGVFTPSTAKLPGNSGAAFYASQTFSKMAPADNRLVRMGWAQISTPGMPFNQSMYFPTELKLRTTPDGVRLCSTPIAEITNSLAISYGWTNLTLSPGNNPLSGIRGTLFHLKALFTPGNAQTINFSFQGVTVAYNVPTGELSCNGRSNILPASIGRVQVEIIVDRNTVEIFGDGGRLYMPIPVGNPAGNQQISLTCSGGNATFNSLTVNKLKSIWTGSSK